MTPCCCRRLADVDWVVWLTGHTTHEGNPMRTRADERALTVATFTGHAIFATGLLLIALKIGHLIAWSWWWVLTPLWIPPTLGVIISSLVLGALRGNR